MLARDMHIENDRRTRYSEDENGSSLWEGVMENCCKCSTGCCKDVCENIILADDVLAIPTVQNCQDATEDPTAPKDGSTKLFTRPEDIEECQDTPGWNKYSTLGLSLFLL